MPSIQGAQEHILNYNSYCGKGRLVFNIHPHIKYIYTHKITYNIINLRAETNN